MHCQYFLQLIKIKSLTSRSDNTTLLFHHKSLVQFFKYLLIQDSIFTKIYSPVSTIISLSKVC